MSDERQPQQQHLNNSGNKLGKDNNNATNTNLDSTPQNSAPPRKSNIHEMRNQEFVSRLMAATPPYLYSAPVGPNNFFFSDMLRSLVQARNNETARNLQLQQQAALARRPRKRAWSQPHRAYYEQHLRERKEMEEQRQQQPQQQSNNSGNNEKPLELTTGKPFLHMAHKYRKLDEAVKELSHKQQTTYGSSKFAPTTEITTANNSAETNNNNNDNANANATSVGGGAVDAVLQNNTPPAASLPPQDLVLPPPPPVWYPPLYPPYGIDPLHFFIDLRVGHIYDRKKENVSPLTSGGENGTATNNDSESPTNPPVIPLPNKYRHGSAFTVPVPRSNELTKSQGSQGLHTSTDAINLSSNTISNKFEHYAKYYDLGESGESKENQPHQPFLKNSYMLQHLPRLYSQFAARDLIGQHIEQSVLSHNNNNKNSNESSDITDMVDNKSEDADCDADSTDGRISNDAVDVEIIDSIKYRNDGIDGGDSSRCSSDDASITQID